MHGIAIPAQTHSLNAGFLVVSFLGPPQRPRAYAPATFFQNRTYSRSWPMPDSTTNRC